MKKLLLLALCSACGSPATSTPAMPWLRGFSPVATTDNDSDGWHVVADVAPNDGLETVLASYDHGISVVGRGGKLLARAPGFQPAGSADDLVALSVGDAGIGSPVIALAVDRGGHRESVTSVALYRVDGGRLQQLAELEVEDRAGSDTYTGDITFVPGALIYRAPRAPTVTVWVLDAARGRYIERATIRSGEDLGAPAA